jgi:hypothetical protein
LSPPSCLDKLSEEVDTMPCPGGNLMFLEDISPLTFPSPQPSNEECLPLMQSFLPLGRIQVLQVSRDSFQHRQRFRPPNKTSHARNTHKVPLDPASRLTQFIDSRYIYRYPCTFSLQSPTTSQTRPTTNPSPGTYSTPVDRPGPPRTPRRWRCSPDPP